MQKNIIRFLEACLEMSVDMILHFHSWSTIHTLDYGSFNLLVLVCKKSKSK